MLKLSEYLPSRDSKVWLWAVLGAFLTYLSQQPVPTEWSYGQWLAFASFAVATFSAKNAQSNLQSKAEKDATK